MCQLAALGADIVLAAFGLLGRTEVTVGTLISVPASVLFPIVKDAGLTCLGHVCFPQGARCGTGLALERIRRTLVSCALVVLALRRGFFWLLRMASVERFLCAALPSTQLWCRLRALHAAAVDGASFQHHFDERPAVKYLSSLGLPV